MRKLFLLSFLLIFVIAEGRQIPESEAAAVASEFFNSSPTKQLPAKTGVRRAKKRLAADADARQPFYVFNAGDKNGFVIISGDDRAQRILGYSDSGSFDYDNLPPQLDDILNRYADQIAAMPDDAPAHPSWKTSVRSGESGQEVVLETAQWGQLAPYNSQCPVINGVQAPTGCVATAMAIIMKYHNWPECGRKKAECNYWNENGVQTLSADFSTFRPKWDKMLPAYKQGSYTDDNARAVAELMLMAGISANMQYSPAESGAGVLGVMTSLRRYFNYTSKMDELFIEQMDNADWEARIKTDIDNNCPVFYYGQGTGAHAFVIDGYSDSGLFHVNWGWDGQSNGFFTLANLSPDGYNFTQLQGMAVGIRPATDDDAIWSDYYMADEKYFNNNILKSINPSVENIVQNQPFSAAVPYILCPLKHRADIGIAIVDKNYSIKQVLAYDSWGSISPVLSGTNPPFENLIPTCLIEDTDRLQLVVKEEGEKDWLLVNSSNYVCSSISVRNNVPQMTDVHWDVDPRFDIEFFDMREKRNEFISAGSDINELKNKFLVGLDYRFRPFNADAYRGIFSAIMINNQMAHICVNKATLSQWAIGKFTALPKTYDIKIMGLFPGDERTETFRIDKVGDLQPYIDDDKNTCHITDFTLSGNGSDKDYLSIRNNMPFISRLDLSAYNPVDGNLPDACFAGLPNLSKVIIPECVSSIGEGSFAGAALDNVTISSGVRYIGSRAFANYSAYFDAPTLSAVFCKAQTPPEVGDSPFGDNSNTALYVLPGCKDLYASHPYWSTFARIIEDDAPVMDIDIVIVDGIRYKVYSDYAEIIGPEEGNCPDEVVFKESVVSKGRTVPVTDIACKAFEYSSLKKVTVPKSVINWSSCVFAYSDITDAIIEAPIKVLPDYTFDSCVKLTNLSLPNTIETLGIQSINCSYSMKRLKLPASLKSMWLFSIRKLRALEEIILPEENKNFKLVDGVLYSNDMTTLYLYPSGDKSRERFIIPEGVKLISEYLIGSPTLKEIVIPTSLIDLPISLFYGFEWEILKLHDGIIRVPPYCFTLPYHLTLGKNLCVMYPQNVYGQGREYAVYCNNELTLSDFKIANEIGDNIISYYSGQLSPNIILEPELDGDQRVYIPGKANWADSNFESSKIFNMWEYEIDRSNGAVMVKPQIDGLVIDGVTIDGVRNDANSYGIYHYDPVNGANPDVVVDFTMHEIQSMTTHYDADFNASLPDTDLSGIEDIFEDESDRLYDVYNPQGLMLRRGCSADELKDLAPGIFILKQGTSVQKVVIR